MVRVTVLICAVFATLSWGCSKDSLDIKVRFAKVYGLKADAPVIFEDNDIGHVTGITYLKEGHYLVDLSIDKSFSGAATEHSKFFIAPLPTNQSKKAVEIVRIHSGGVPLRDGAVVQGSTRVSAVIGQIEEDFKKGMESARKSFEDFFESMRGVPESEEFKSLEQEIEGLVEDILRSGKSMRDKLDREVIPKLKEEIEKLRKRLEELGRQNEADQLETKMKKI